MPQHSTKDTWVLIHAEREALIADLQTLTPEQWTVPSLCPAWNVHQMVGHLVALTKQTLAELIDHRKDTTAPPGPVDSWIGEVVVHAADIRRPLGISYSPPVTTSRQVADFYKNSNLLIGAKKRITDVKLVATDTDWVHGSGPEVRGRILSLVQAMTGRAVALEDLAGPGVAVLSSRKPAR